MPTLYGPVGAGILSCRGDAVARLDASVSRCTGPWPSGAASFSGAQSAFASGSSGEGPVAAGLSEVFPAAIAGVIPTPRATASAPAEPTALAITLREWRGRRCFMEPPCWSATVERAIDCRIPYRCGDGRTRTPRKPASRLHVPGADAAVRAARGLG